MPDSGRSDPSPPPHALDDPRLYINRELSWLEFNARVLRQAEAPSVPLLERLKFVAITAANLDEFFMVRVAGLLEQRAGAVREVSLDGLSPNAQLQAIAARVPPMLARTEAALLDAILPDLARLDVHLRKPQTLGPAAEAFLRAHFQRQVQPVLTPLAIDPGHPFPQVRNRSLNLIAMLSRTPASATPDAQAAPAFVVVQVPSVLPRLLRVPGPDGDRGATFVLLEDVIARYLVDFFPGATTLGAWSFRVIRNFDLSIDEEEAEDLLESIEEEVRRRDRGNAVCLMLDAGAAPEAEAMLQGALGVDDAFVFRRRGPLALPDLSALGEPLQDMADLKDPSFSPEVLPPLRHSDDLFATIAKEDVLLHHPYESFEPVVHFIETAAEDARVLAIKQTLYRTSGDSPVIKALMRAAQAGKQVTALVEIKARFDEENNIQWARMLEEAGVHVVYGLVGLKTHSKVALVVRREEGELRRYVHLGTGNYNPHTAKLYTDLSLFTADVAIGEDASSLFNLLTCCTAPPSWRKLVVAPLGLHERVLALIAAEAEAARAGRPARIIAKLNSLVDPDVIQALYRASQAGVPIDLVVRGICCLRPGVPGVSEHIQVRSIVDRFLEHSRIYHFEAGGARHLFASSADWMQRNFHRRVEVMFPIDSPSLKARILDDILALPLKDNCSAFTLDRDGAYHRLAPAQGQPPVRSQLAFLKGTRNAAIAADKALARARPFWVRPVRNRPTQSPEGSVRETLSTGTESLRPPAPER
ncbi:MAG: polyphosphate kinase 1 [Polyangiales bacterium]